MKLVNYIKMHSIEGLNQVKVNEVKEKHYVTIDNYLLLFDIIYFDKIWV